MPSWWTYLQQISGSATGASIAHTAGVDPGNISRWKAGTVHPTAETVISVARAYDRPPVEALIAAGHLTAAESDRLITAERPIADFTDRELVDEIYRRLPGEKP